MVKLLGDVGVTGIVGLVWVASGEGVE